MKKRKVQKEADVCARVQRRRVWTRASRRDAQVTGTMRLLLCCSQKVKKEVKTETTKRFAMKDRKR